MSTIGALPAVSLYLADSRNETQSVTAFQSDNAQVKSDTAYFQSVAATLTTPDKLLNNYRALSVVLNAFGVSSSVNDTAMLKQLMTQDPTQTSSLAKKLGDPKLQRFAVAMNGFNPPPFSNSGDVTATIQASATNSYEKAQDTLSPGLQQALYFKRNIASVTSINGLMSDTSLLNVAVTAAGLDVSQFGNLDFTQQQAVLTQKINLADFQNPTKVDSMAESYLVRQGQGANGAPTAASYALSVLNGTADGSAQSVLGAVYGTTGNASPTDLLSILYPSSTASSGDPLLQLFA
jgi:Protein of unknown function (DUF1217)